MNGSHRPISRKTIGLPQPALNGLKIDQAMTGTNPVFHRGAAESAGAIVKKERLVERHRVHTQPYIDNPATPTTPFQNTHRLILSEIQS